MHVTFSNSTGVQSLAVALVSLSFGTPASAYVHAQKFAKHGPHASSVCFNRWDAQAGEVVYVISTLVGLMLWGMGFWWLVHGVTCVAARFFFGGLKFNMGFWCATCCVHASGTCAPAPRPH